MPKIQLPKEFTTVTPLSKILALIIFLTFPIYGFLLGAYFQRLADLNNQPPVIINYILKPTPIPTGITPSTLSCRTSQDCPSDYRCLQSGPIAIDPRTGQSRSNKACVKNGTIIPL